MPDVTVPAGMAIPPESNAEIKPAVLQSLRPGAMVGGDGGQAIKSSAKEAGAPLIYAHHGRVPRQPGALLARVGVEHRAGRLAGQQLGLADLLAAEGEVSCELAV